MSYDIHYQHHLYAIHLQRIQIFGYINGTVLALTENSLSKGIWRIT